MESIDTTHTLDTFESRMWHVEQYAYKPHDWSVSGPLIEHLMEKHPDRYARWVADKTVGDAEDEHYLAHGLLGGDAQVLADVEAEGNHDVPAA